jgi:hypothetical protein
VEAIDVRAIVTVALWAVFTVSEAGAVAAQADADAGRAATRDKLEALLAAYAPARAMRFHRNAKQPFNIDGSINSGLTYASTFEIVITITERQTIASRVYPHYQGPYINLEKVREPSGLMEKLLRLSDHGFFFWAADEAMDVFAGYTITLESGFPEEAVKVVIRSIPLLDESVGQMGPLID